jgi:hypothetical protein
MNIISSHRESLRSFDESLALSDLGFAEHAAPLVKDYLGLQYIAPVRGASPPDELAQMLDCDAGIDFWARQANGTIIGIATRTLFQTAIFGSFTMRLWKRGAHTCELAKRFMEIMDPQVRCLGPTYTVFTTIEPRGQHRCLSVSMADTRSLVLAAINPRHAHSWTVVEGNRHHPPFLNLWHRGLRAAGVPVIHLKAPCARVIHGIATTETIDLQFPPHNIRTPVPLRRAA